MLAGDRNVGRTPTKYKEKNPYFGEDIFLTLTDDETFLTVILWKESNKKGKKNPTELGRTKVILENVVPGDNWYTLELEKKGNPVKTNIDVRMAIIYHEITILPSDKYEKLLDMLMDKKSDFKVIMIISTSGEIKSKEAADFAELLVQIGESRGGMVPDLVNTLLAYDIRTADCQETLFRGNSVGTKALDYYMKLIAARWLECLRPIVQTINGTDKCCEVRDNKLNSLDVLPEHLKNLAEFFEATTKAIFSSVRQCPIPLRRIFHFIRNEVSVVFPDSDVKYTAITGFLFLRFFAPALMTPKLFKLAGDYSTGNTERTFTLVAQLLQKLANLQLFDPHEAHLDKLNPLLLKEQENMRKFIDFLSESPDPVDEKAINVAIPVDLDLIVARLCRKFSEHLKPLENSLSDKMVVLFLGELDLVFEEMKFLCKKFKNAQQKRLESHTAPSTPVRERAQLLRGEPEKVKRRHSFSFDRLGIVKSQTAKRDKSLSFSADQVKNPDHDESQLKSPEKHDIESKTDSED
uniref:Ras-GAP domain-containing protein n=1 Tax=Arcella intermedia TaxID=1963864 RepID=A0A6B2L1H9_9EUKA